MSKKRHRKRQEVNNGSNLNNNNNNRQQQMNYNNPFGINPNQLLSMFGNIDMNQINSMLQSMNTEGFDFNNFNLGSLQNLMNGMGRTQNQQNGQQNQRQGQQNMQRNTNMNNASKKNVDEIDDSYDYDENIQLLNSFRNIVGEEKKEFIDKIIKLYNDGAFED